MGPQASSTRIQAGSALGGIGDTIAVGCVLYTKNFAIVPNDCFWTPAKENVTNFVIVPFGDIHVFIGETVAGSMATLDGPEPRPIRTAIEQDTFAEDQPRSSHLETIGLIEAARSNLVNSRPTQSALVENAKVEDQSQPPRLETIGLVKSHGSDLIKTRPTQTALGRT